MRFLLTASVFLGTSLTLSRADVGAVKEPEAVTLWLSPDRGYTQQHCDKIHPGMSVDQAAVVLGCPPGDYTGGKGVYVAFIDPFPVKAVRRAYEKYWCGYLGAIGLVLDKEGKVANAYWHLALDPADWAEYWREIANSGNGR